MAEKNSNDSDLIDTVKKDYGKHKHHSSLLSKIQSLQTRMRFNHHTLYRKAIEFAISLTMMASCIVLGVHNNHTYMIRQAETLTNYSSNVSFSHSSNTNMKIHHIQLSGNRRTAYIPFSFNTMDSVSENANKYLIKVGAVNGYMKHPVIGQMLVFGPSARGVILLHSEHRIANQPIYVIVRNLAHINTNDDDDSGGGELEGASTSANNQQISEYEHRHDALHFKVNPGAKKSKHNDKLSTSSQESQIYDQLFGIPDAKKVEKGNRKDRSQISVAEQSAHEYTADLKRLGFRVPKTPKWMASNWRPYDAIMPNGVPKNKEGKVNAKDVASDAAYSPVSDDDDQTDNVKFPSVLRKKDGTTTDSDNNSNVKSGDDQSNNDNNGSNNINGGNVNNPASLWSNLQQAWHQVLELKHNIYTTNAATLFKIKATVNQQNKVTTKGEKKHFQQLN